MEEEPSKNSCMGLEKFRNDPVSSNSKGESVARGDIVTANKSPTRPVKRAQMTPLENQVLKLKALHPGKVYQRTY